MFRFIRQLLVYIRFTPCFAHAIALFRFWMWLCCTFSTKHLIRMVILAFRLFGFGSVLTAEKPGGFWLRFNLFFWFIWNAEHFINNRGGGVVGLSTNYDKSFRISDCQTFEFSMSFFKWVVICERTISQIIAKLWKFIYNFFFPCVAYEYDF